MYDAAIIGGGPAGSTAATVLAREGLSAVVIDREKFPRFRIGESLLPRMNEIFDRLGLSRALENERFTPKSGGQFVSNDGLAEYCFDFPPGSQWTMEVERETFDHLLLENARSKGAEIREETTVLEFAYPEGGPCRLKLREKDGAESTLEARWTIDASGQGSLLARQHDLRLRHPTHQKVAIFARYRGAGRRPQPRTGNLDICLSLGGWFWLIPLRNDLTSVGYVADTRDWKESGLEPAAYLNRAIERSPFVAERLRNASVEGEILTAANYSYGSKRLSGPGFVLTGDAAEFLDPIFSTGVYLAMRSAERTAQILARALKSGPGPTSATFGGYEKTFRKWCRTHFTMIEAFYAPGFPPLLFRPKNPFGLMKAIVGLLAGESEPGFLDRMRLKLFYWLVRRNAGQRLQKDPRVPECAVPHG